MQITLPKKPHYTSIDKKTANFEIDGCYPGYGTTLGNALRRVLLSSLSGAAIISVKIKNVDHEFSTIENVAEDVIQIILNLKQVRFKLHGEDSARVSLKVKGEKKITAADIKCPSNVEVVSKDVHIASVTSPKGEVEMEMEISAGIGYVPVEQQNREKKEVGVIAIDAIYTPIRRVNYTISNTRVGKRTDFEKINLEVTTDGSITPEDAFSQAVDILVEQFSKLKELEKAGKVKANEAVLEKETVEKESEVENEETDPAKIEVSELKSLSTRTLNVLEKASIKNIGDIVKLSEAELSELDGMGAKGIKEIKKATGDFGLNLKKSE